MKSQAKILFLLVPFLAGIVLMLVIRVELDMPAEREHTTCIEIGGAHFVVLAQVVGFDGHIWTKVIRANRHRSLQRNLISIAPQESTSLPIQIGAVPVTDQEPALKGEVKG